MTKILRLTLIIFVMAVNNVNACAIDYGESEIYTRADMYVAIKLIEKTFNEWDGCKLLNIRYGGDENNNAENITWMNDLAAGKGHEPNFTQCIEFLSDFYASADVGSHTAFEPDRQYINWQWWLARNNGGDWILLTFGY